VPHRRQRRGRSSTRAGYRRDLVPRPALSSPLVPPCLGTGMDPVPPLPGGKRRWRGAKVCWGVLGARLVPEGGCGAPRHDRGTGSHRASVGTAKPVPVPRLGAGEPQCPCFSATALGKAGGCRGGREMAAAAGAPCLGAWGSLPVSLGCHESRRRRALSTDASKSIHASAPGWGESSPSNACGRAAQPARLPR